MKYFFSFLTLAFVSSTRLVAQTDVSPLILSKDSLFWQAYNTCAIEKLSEFISDDVEFYHDKGGITTGLTALNASVKNNLCSNPGYRIRREAVQGTVKVFPLQQANVIYGAIVSGDHYFHVTETGKPEKREGLAKFMNLWLLKDGNWKMTRILSYDHGPAPYVNTRKATALAASRLNGFAGKYKGPKSGMITVTRKENMLTMTVNNNSFALYPESANRFFMNERDITVDFTADANGKITGLAVRENGQVVEQAGKIVDR